MNKKNSICILSCLLAMITIFVSSCQSRYQTVIHIDYATYCESAEELVEAVDFVYEGQVLDVSFEIWELGSGTLITEKNSKELPQENRMLYTVYHIQVNRSYKGDVVGEVKLRIQGGIENVREEEQRKLLRERTEKRPISIPVLATPVVCEIGGTYLFALCQDSIDAHSVLNAQQAVYSVENPLAEDDFHVSTEKILSVFDE